MENKAIDQKEYLKRYTSFGDADDVKRKKKKKKRHKVGTKTLKIIDDDIDLKNMRPIEEGEFDILVEGEDAPQIAGIVDERGPVDFSDKRRWKIVTENEEGDLTITSRTVETERGGRDDDADLTSSGSKYSGQDRRLNPRPRRRSRADDSDSSPPRRAKNSNPSPPRRSRHRDSDLSPPRRSRNDDSDQSPSGQRQVGNSDSDLSPPRKSRNYDSDLSPPRRGTKHPSSARGATGRSCRSTGGNQRGSDSDFSPPRKRKQNLDADYLSAPRRNEHRSRRDDSPRASSRKGHSDKDPSRSGRHDARSIRSSDEQRRNREYDDRERKSGPDASERRRRRRSRWEDKEPDNEPSEHCSSKARDGRMTKTLDGKTAGLQDARALREETEAHKRRETEQFSKLSKTVSGVGQAPVVRDKTGRRRDFAAEAAEERERETRQRELDEKYAKWGKGLKQMEDREERLKSDLREMSKPLARYADDEDLDKELREQEREGDPMLEYIKKKQIKEGKRKPDPPKYEGSYTPNRFGIKPGYRWDGVDRSNGYEKKWFEAQNTKVARQEEAYKWSTADM